MHRRWSKTTAEQRHEEGLRLARTRVEAYRVKARAQFQALGVTPTDEDVERSAEHMRLADLADRRILAHESAIRRLAERKAYRTAHPTLHGVPAAFLRLPEFRCILCTPNPWAVVIGGQGELVQHPNDGTKDSYRHRLTTEAIFERTFDIWCDGPQRGLLEGYADFLDRWRATLAELDAERYAHVLASEQSDRELLARLGEQMAEFLPAVLPQLDVDLDR
jgi:hypothetical protein